MAQQLTDSQRRALLSKYARSQFSSKEINHCHSFVNVIKKSVELVEGNRSPAKSLLEDLKHVLVGKGLTERCKGKYAVCNTNKFGAKGFKDELKDKSDQVAHSTAALYIRYNYYWLGQYMAIAVGERLPAQIRKTAVEKHDILLYEQAGNIAAQLNDKNYKQLPMKVRNVIGNSTCKAQ